VGLTSSSTPNRSYRPDIDGLRAVAILSVVLYHAGLSWLPGGFTGVDIFFVISGYLIGGHIFSEVRAGSFSFPRFYQRRVRRILPAFYAVLFFTIAAALLLLSPLEARQFGRSAFAAILSVSNIVFWYGAKYFDTRSEFVPLLMTWSLGVEEQFYAIVPLLMVLLARLRRSLILPAILAICALSFFLAQHELMSQSEAALQSAFYLLPARGWELGVGLALAVAELSSNRKALPPAICRYLAPIGLLLMLCPVVLLTSRSPFPGVAALPSVLGTAMLIAVPAGFINRRLLSLPPLVFVGRVSYSWYLWHWPLLAFVHIVNGSKLPLALPLLTVAAAFALAIVSYFLIEQPFRRSTRQPAPLFLRYALVSAAMLVVCACIWLSHGLPHRYPVLARIEPANPTLASDKCLVQYDEDRPNLSPSCYAAMSARTSVAIWGDSHAAALAPGLRALAIAQGYGFVQLTKAACLPLAGVMRYIPRIPAQASRCLNFNRQVFDLIQADPRIRIVVLAGVWSGCLERNWENGWLIADTSRQPRNPSLTPSLSALQTLFIRSLNAQIQTLRAAGKYIIVLEDVPGFDFDPLSRVRAAHIPARNALAIALGTRNRVEIENSAVPGIDPAMASNIDPGFAPNNGNAFVDAIMSASLQQAVPTQDGAQLVDLKPSFCIDASLCAYRDGDRLLYFDSSHLTAYGANFALRKFRLPALPVNYLPSQKSVQ
jgi:peptidoglycan/LPS O-acetylase OafA/YrhL